MKKIAGWVVALAGSTLLAACGGGGGGGTSTQSLPPGFYVKIENMTFDPAELAVPPGATVTVVNKDGSTPHTATSEAAANDFTPGTAGGVTFDTGQFTGTRTFTIPATGLTDGTIVPYYCAVHKGAMTPPNPTIRIDSTAQPSVPSWSMSGSSGSGNSGGMGGGGY